MIIKTITIKKVKCSDTGTWVDIQATFECGYEWGMDYHWEEVERYGLLECIDECGRHGRYADGMDDTWVDAAWAVRELVKSEKEKRA